MAQTLDFASGEDLRVLGWRSTLGSMLSEESPGRNFPLPLLLPLLLLGAQFSPPSPSLKVSKKKKIALDCESYVPLSQGFCVYSLETFS